MRVCGRKLDSWAACEATARQAAGGSCSLGKEATEPQGMREGKRWSSGYLEDQEWYSFIAEQSEEPAWPVWPASLLYPKELAGII